MEVILFIFAAAFVGAIAHYVTCSDKKHDQLWHEAGSRRKDELSRSLACEKGVMPVIGCREFKAKLA